MASFRLLTQEMASILNDPAHRILNQRVIDEDILNIISDTLTSPEMVLANLFLENTSICGEMNTNIVIVVANLGIAPFISTFGNITILDKTTGIPSQNGYTSSGPIGACSTDTFRLPVNTYQPVNWSIRAYLISGDTMPENDSSDYLPLRTLGHPVISTQNDSICFERFGIALGVWQSSR